MYTSFTTAAALLLLIQDQAYAHSWMTSPEPRIRNVIRGEKARNICNQKEFGKAGIAKYQRGQDLEIKWVPNNHIAGFVNIAIVAKDQADNADLFQKPENVYLTSCNRPKSCPKLKGEKETPENQACKQSMKIPSHLPNGQYSMQWLQYGAGHSGGNPKESHPAYSSCHDFEIVGGPQGPAPTCTPFFGGDLQTEASDLSQCNYYEATYPTFTTTPIMVEGYPKNLPKGRPTKLNLCSDTSSPSYAANVTAPISGGSAAPIATYPAGGKNSTIKKSCENSKRRRRHYVL